VPPFRSVLASIALAVLHGGGLATVAGVSDAAAAVHKCVGRDGTVYQDRPCGTAASEGDLSDAPLSVLPAPSPGRTVERREPVPRPPRIERIRRNDAVRMGNPSERRHLRVGMSEGEVMARAGPPDLTTGKGRKQARWTWMPVPGDPDTITVVLFETGRAVEVERTVIKR
jgi:hypothetical protein